MALYRVLAGKHHEGNHGKGTHRVYVRGDIVESDNDLTTFNSRGAIKFERVNESGQPIRESVPARNVNPVSQQAPPSGSSQATVNAATAVMEAPAAVYQQASGTPSPSIPTLEQMNVAELKALAAAEEVELGNANRKDEIIKLLRAANVTKAAEAGYKS